MLSEEKFNLSNIKNIHFIGVGGIGMSALARLFLNEKKNVSGSDRTKSEITDNIQDEGVVFFEDQVAENITDDIDLVIYTEAMPQDHPELVASREKGITTVNYFEALGTVANKYYLIAVAGTHGKTTTTAMLADILEEASFDPTVIVGSLRSKTKSNFRAGKSKYCIVEACEYRRDFLHLTPDLLVITNIEAEHLDYYRDLADVQDAFRELIGQVREGGIVVANTEDEKVSPCLKDSKVKIIDYTKYLDPLTQLKHPGIHNHMNAAAARAASSGLDIEDKIAKTALEHFSGTWRRFEYKGELNGAQVYDDYGHHPTEIEATLNAVKETFPNKKIVLVFQPHLASRTEKLLEGFSKTLAHADKIILAHTYAARKQDLEGVLSEELATKVREKNPNTEYFEDFESIEEHLKDTVEKDDIVLIMGAGDIGEVANSIIS